MYSTTPLPTREQFLESCLLTLTTTDEEPCAICLENYDVAPTEADPAVQEESHLWHTLCQTPSCGHKFGFSCLVAWAKEHNTCPMCRRESYQRDESEDSLWDERPNRAMEQELVIGPEWEVDDMDEEEFVAY